MPRDTITSYLHYLMDMSRKLTMRSGMENVLKGTKRNPAFFKIYTSDSDDKSSQKYLYGVNQHIDAEESRRLFLGLGLLHGSVRKNSRKRRIAAPLIYVLADLEPDSDGKQSHYDLSIEWDSAVINYDLLTLLLDQDTPEEDNSDGDPAGTPGDRSYSVFEEVEEMLDRWADNEDAEELFTQGSITDDLLATLKSEFPEFSLIKKTADVFDYNKPPQAKEGHLDFYDINFLYVMSVPSQLSTYTALRQLLKQSDVV